VGGGRVRRGISARRVEDVWAQDASAPYPSSSDYDFLLERYVDRATLHRAEALAKKWGVLPHAVMIANRWLSEVDYYRALAHACGVPFRAEIGPHEVAAPGSLTSPRQCLAHGIMKERARAGVYVYAPERLRPNALMHVLGRLAPQPISLAAPQALRKAVCGYFAQTFATAAIDGLRKRFPDRSARERLPRFASGKGNSADLAFGIELPPLAARVRYPRISEPPRTAGPTLAKPQTEKAFGLISEVERLRIDAVLARGSAGRTDFVDHSRLRVEGHRLDLADSGLTLGEACARETCKQGEGDAVALLLVGVALDLDDRVLVFANEGRDGRGVTRRHREHLRPVLHRPQTNKEWIACCEGGHPPEVPHAWEIKGSDGWSA